MISHTWYYSSKVKVCLQHQKYEIKNMTLYGIMPKLKAVNMKVQN